MPQTQYNLHLKGFVGGADFDRNYVDYVLAKNAGKEVNVLIDSLGGNLATAVSIAAAFKNHGKVSVHFVGMNASAATIALLDLVLTPNGFGVVSNQNVAPASKERVDRLIASLADYRGECIANLLPAIVGASQWLTSSQASFFGETLFPDLAITDQVKGTGSKWERYLALSPMILDIEASLAEEFFSPELMVRLRNEVLRKTHTADLARVISAIRGQVVDYLNGGSIKMRDMIDVVNHIRNNPDLFPEWHASETAKLFSPPIFKNKKEAKGYFF